MSLIFDALRELETQPARAEPFAIAAAKRSVPAAPLRQLRRRVAAVALLLIGGGAAITLLYAFGAHPAPPSPVAAATGDVALPTPAPVVPLAATVSAPTPAVVVPLAAAAPAPTPVAAPRVAAGPAATPAVAPLAAAPAATDRVMTGSPAPSALPAMAAAPPESAAPAASPHPDRGGAVGATAAAAVPAPAPASATATALASGAAPTQAGATRPMIEDTADRQRIVVSSARTAAAATPLDDLAVQRGVATFSAAMQRKDFAVARHDLDGLAAQLPPDSLTLLRLRAWHALATADGAHARDLYEQIIARVADDENAAINLSVLDAHDGHIERARERLKHLLTRNPGSAQIAGVLRSLDERGA